MTPERAAARDGLITRHLDAEHIETATLYDLTNLARSLDEALAAFGRWAKANWERVEAARRDWDRRAGRGLTPNTGCVPGTSG